MIGDPVQRACKRLVARGIAGEGHPWVTVRRDMEA